MPRVLCIRGLPFSCAREKGLVLSVNTHFVCSFKVFNSHCFATSKLKYTFALSIRREGTPPKDLAVNPSPFSFVKRNSPRPYCWGLSSAHWLGVQS
nr:MAG TPA: hypothetical protein [Caudoviricetes sp.]